jgi:ATP-dependent DNA ligase
LYKGDICALTKCSSGITIELRETFQKIFAVLSPDKVPENYNLGKYRVDVLVAPQVIAEISFDCFKKNPNNDHRHSKNIWPFFLRFTSLKKLRFDKGLEDTTPGEAIIEAYKRSIDFERADN